MLPQYETLTRKTISIPEGAKFSIEKVGKTKGYDGHCLRAFAYFKDQMPDIIDTVESINSIKEKYPDLRQDSKPNTFLLTYGGTYHGLMRTLGILEEAAKRTEKNFKTLYAKSIEYIKEKIEEASRVGYVTTAFGLRLRTPLLKQVILDSDSVPYEAMSEARSAGNALGQGYGLLNNRAAIAFMEKVWASPYRYKIFPSALIHDAIYLIVEDDAEVLEWVNTHLIKEMQWQELPEIMHDEVKLGANLEIFWPNWSKPIEIPNEMDASAIQEICSKHKKDIVWNRK